MVNCKKCGIRIQAEHTGSNLIFIVDSWFTLVRIGEICGKCKREVIDFITPPAKGTTLDQYPKRKKLINPSEIGNVRK